MCVLRDPHGAAGSACLDLLSVYTCSVDLRHDAHLHRIGAQSGRRDMAVLAAKGFTNPEVAEELYVSRKAVEYHLGNIFGKLGITSPRELRGRTF